MKPLSSCIVLIVAFGLFPSALAQDAPMFRGALQLIGVHKATGVAQLHGITDVDTHELQ